MGWSDTGVVGSDKLGPDVADKGRAGTAAVGSGKPASGKGRAGTAVVGAVEAVVAPEATGTADSSRVHRYSDHRSW